jgi:hypothetical protein
MDARCKFSRPPGVPCGLPAPHRWGPLDLCCSHFDELVTAMFDLQSAVRDRRHEDLIKIFEEGTKRSSLAEGSTCEEKWTPRIHIIDEKKKTGES